MKIALCENVSISVSLGNRKVGLTPSISLPPVKTCPKGAPCYRKCYAARMIKYRKGVKDSYESNLEAYEFDSEKYFLAISKFARSFRFFRWHVSGDIPSCEYLAGMVRVACECTGTLFLCFTKQYDIVNDFAERNRIPENLVVVFSAWDGLEMSNPNEFPCAYVIPKRTSEVIPFPANAFVCSGSCDSCTDESHHCWTMKRGDSVAFPEH